MKKLLTALLLSVTLIQLCWAAVGPYREHSVAQLQTPHTSHHQQVSADPSPQAQVGQAADGAHPKNHAGYCSSCEMQAGSLGYPATVTLRFQRVASLAPWIATHPFSSHIPEHPEEPDWLATPAHSAMALL